MNNKIKKSIFNKITILIVTITFFSVLGATYAYLSLSTATTTTLNGKMATVNLKLTINQIFPTQNGTGVMVPQKSISKSNNSPLSQALKRACIDSNENIVCQVYEIKIKNDRGTATEVIDGFISFYSNTELTIGSERTMPNLSWKLITSANQSTPNNSILGTNPDNTASGQKAKFISNVKLTTNSEKEYYMIIWFNEIGIDQIDKNNTFYGKVEINSSNGTGVTAEF